MKVIRKEDEYSNIYVKNFEIKYPSDSRKKKEESGKIVVYMADGSKPRYDNLPEKKVRLLEVMHRQHLKNRKELPKLKRKKALGKVLGTLMVGGIVVASTLGAMDYYDVMNFLNYQYSALITAGLSVTTFVDLATVTKLSNKIKEIKKYDYLEQNQELLNTADLENKNIVENVKSNDKKELQKIKESKDKDHDTTFFDYNSINNLSLEALVELKANIEREYFLNPNTKESTTKDNTVKPKFNFYTVGSDESKEVKEEAKVLAKKA